MSVLRRTFLKIAGSAAIAASVSLEQFLSIPALEADAVDPATPVRQEQRLSTTLQALRDQNQKQREWELDHPDLDPWMFHGVITTPASSLGVAAAIARFAQRQEQFDQPKSGRKPVTKELFMSAAGWRK